MGRWHKGLPGPDAVGCMQHGPSVAALNSQAHCKTLAHRCCHPACRSGSGRGRRRCRPPSRCPSRRPRYGAEAVPRRLSSPSSAQRTAVSALHYSLHAPDTCWRCALHVSAAALHCHTVPALLTRACSPQARAVASPPLAGAAPVDDNAQPAQPLQAARAAGGGGDGRHACVQGLHAQVRRGLAGVGEVGRVHCAC